MWYSFLCNDLKVNSFHKVLQKTKSFFCFVFKLIKILENKKIFKTISTLVKQFFVTQIQKSDDYNTNIFDWF